LLNGAEDLLFRQLVCQAGLLNGLLQGARGQVQVEGLKLLGDGTSKKCLQQCFLCQY
jgi:hypothetical protein